MENYTYYECSFQTITSKLYNSSFVDAYFFMCLQCPGVQTKCLGDFSLSRKGIQAVQVLAAGRGSKGMAGTTFTHTFSEVGGTMLRYDCIHDEWIPYNFSGVCKIDVATEHACMANNYFII